MYPESPFPDRRIFCIDSVSFYASCECRYRNLPPLTTKLAVVSDLKRSGSVVLAASPALKKLGIKTASRLYQIEQLPIRERKQILLVEPQMLAYMKTSIEVLDVLHQFAPPDAIRIYSIDENFIDMTGTERLFGTDDEAAKAIQSAIWEQIGIPVRIGIGPNNVVAKLVLDLLGKREGIARCGYADVSRLLHDFPIRKMWGVGQKMEQHLLALGIETIGDLAASRVEDLHERFGVLGAELWHHAWGIDSSPTTIDPTALFQTAPAVQRTIGHGVTLMRDYYQYEQIRLVLAELAGDVAARVRFSNQVGWTVHLGVRYSRHVLRSGFSKQLRLPYPTADERLLLRHLLQLFEPNWMEGEPIRFLSVALGQLTADQGALQLSLFEDNRKVWRRKRLLKAMDRVNLRYGKGTIRLAVSFLDTSVAKRRLRFVGGHPGVTCMTRYRDRGNLKWIPFLMPEHVQLLKAYYLEKHRIDFPVIDEQLQYPWQFLLEEALIEGNELEITYYSERGYVTTSGFIEHIHREHAYVVLRGASRIQIPFAGIVRIENG